MFIDYLLPPSLDLSQHEITPYVMRINSELFNAGKGQVVMKTVEATLWFVLHEDNGTVRLILFCSQLDVKHHIIGTVPHVVETLNSPRALRRIYRSRSSSALQKSGWEAANLDLTMKITWWRWIWDLARLDNSSQDGVVGIGGGEGVGSRSSLGWRSSWRGGTWGSVFSLWGRSRRCGNESWRDGLCSSRPGWA